VTNTTRPSTRSTAAGNDRRRSQTHRARGRGYPSITVYHRADSVCRQRSRWPSRLLGRASTSFLGGGRAQASPISLHTRVSPVARLGRMQSDSCIAHEAGVAMLGADSTPVISGRALTVWPLRWRSIDIRLVPGQGAKPCRFWSRIAAQAQGH